MRFIVTLKITCGKLKRFISIVINIQTLSRQGKAIKTAYKRSVLAYAL